MTYTHEDLWALVDKWLAHEIDPWIECDCGRCAYQRCADELLTILGPRVFA